MAELPKGWATTTVGEVAAIVRGVTYKKADSSDQAGPGLVPVLRATNFDRTFNYEKLVYVPDSCVKQEQYVLPGDVVIASSSGSLSVVGKAAQMRQQWTGAFGAFCTLVRPPSMIAPYLGWFFQTPGYRTYIAKQAAGVNINNLKKKDLLGCVVNVAPLPEQRRIVAAIEQHFSRLDDAVATLERVKAKLGQARASVLKAAVEGRLVPTEAAQAAAEGRDYEHASVLLERILAERRERWEQAAWEKEVDKARQKAAKAHRKAKGRPLQRGEKLDPAEWAHLSEDEYRRYLPKGEKWKAKYKEPVEPDLEGLPALPEGWVWATVSQVSDCIDRLRVPINKKERLKRQGSIPYYGANGQVGWIDTPIFNEPLVLVVEDETFVGRTKPFSYIIRGPSWVNNHAHVLRPIAPMEVGHINVTLARYPFIPLTTGTTGRRKLTQKALNAAPYPLPPLAEQHRIVAEVDRQLSVLDEVGRLVDASLARCARLRQAILKRAFEGRLVPQDPNDEPASVLLERIKAQAAATPKKNTRRRSRKETP